MKRLRFLIQGALLIIVLASCAATSGEEREKVLCPACGTEFDALYHKHF